MAIEEVFGGKQEHMVSLADFTRSLFVQDKETREMRIPELSTELSDLAIDFTARRKEEGALRNSILGREIRRFYMVRQKDTQDMWTSKYIETEADFLRFLVTDLLQSGTNLLDPDALIYSRGVPYSAGYVLTRFAAKLNQAKDPYLKACSDIPYHMLAHLRGNAKKSPDKESQDMVIAIIERTKHSQSENKKQAIRWANDNYFLLKLNPYFTYLQLLESAIASDLPQPEFPSRLRDIAKIADELRREEPNEGRRFENRLDELRSRWYYGVGDSNGASIIKSRELIKNGKEYEDIEVLKDFFRSHEVFEIVPGSFDPHMDKSGKPPELQIKIRQKRNNLRRFFNDNGRPDLFDAFYAPDTSELQLYSASGGALKYLTPGVDPLAYKHRSMERQLPDRVAWKYYTSFYTVLQRISPVKETIGEERAAIHAGNIRNNMIAAAARDFSSFPPLLEEAVRMLKDQNMFKYY